MATTTTTMTAAEFRCLREYLGLTNAWLADFLGVQERSVVRWGDGQSPIPPGVVDDMTGLEQSAQYDVAAKEEWLNEQPIGKRQLLTYRTDDALRLVNPSDEFPASWHRAIAARLRERVDGLEIVYAPEE